VTLGQLILDLPHRAAHGAEDFLVSGCSDRRFARTPSALVAADAENSHAEAFARLTPAALGVELPLSTHECGYPPDVSAGASCSNGLLDGNDVAPGD
jgi:hypothetical protein